MAASVLSIVYLYLHFFMKVMLFFQSNFLKSDWYISVIDANWLISLELADWKFKNRSSFSRCTIFWFLNNKSV